MTEAQDWLDTPSSRTRLANFYRKTLLEDVVPFWLRHGLDTTHGGYQTQLDRDGRVIDTDKSVWFLGRGAWLFSELYNRSDSLLAESCGSDTRQSADRRAAWLSAARSGIDFLQRFAASPTGKLYFTLTDDGRPLRMRRYVYSEAFAAIACGAFGKAINDESYCRFAINYFETYLCYSFHPGVAEPKSIISTREATALAPRMIGIVTAQELRYRWGEVELQGRTCTEWIDHWIEEIERLFYKPDEQALMECVGVDGQIIDHAEGRLLNPGHAIECAWFILREAKWRGCERLVRLGTQILDAMWLRGWDEEFGGLAYFRDLRDFPITEYWHDMKFWWPHCEAIIATLFAWTLTGDPKYARWHRQVHEWSFDRFGDPERGEWYGYLHRDGSLSTPLKGSLWKGPFHLPRMLLICQELLSAS